MELRRSKHSSPHRSRANDHNKPFGNQIDFVGGHSHCRMTGRPLRFQLPGVFTPKNGIGMMLAKYKRSSSSYITDKSQKNKNSVNTRWVEPAPNYILLLVIN